MRREYNLAWGLGPPGAWGLVFTHLVHWPCSIFQTSEALAKEVVLLKIDAVAVFQRANPQQQLQDNRANEPGFWGSTPETLRC